MPQPTSKLHTDWLSLIEISGPFLSLPVLNQAFPQGLDELEDGQARSLRADFEFWQENAEDAAVHSAWMRLVLENLLGYGDQGAGTAPLRAGQAIGAGWKAEFPEHEEVLRPDLMLVEPVVSGKSEVVSKSSAPHLLIQVFPPSQDLNKAVIGSRWQASVATRMMELLHATEVRLGLVTNGEQWMLVNAPKGETTGFATWYAGLWFDEPLTLRAFRSLLGVQRFFGVAEDQTLENLLKASANDQQEITDQLGLQVRHAVEILIQMIDRADQDSGGALLGKDVPPSLLYEAALTVMMRLVFLLSAEERKLLPLDEPVYAENYAISTLRAQLREMADQHGEEVLERRFDAWSRLLATFRAVHGGIRHERLNLPPYGGSLFNPEKYPFLEGRSASTAEHAENAEKNKDFSARSAVSAVKKEIPLPVNNRTVLHLLDALQMLQVDGEARRLSFRALDVEQIGHVYEGLLDHQAVRAGETMIGLKGAKRLEPEVALSELEQQSGRIDSFIAWLKDCTGRSDSALRNACASDTLRSQKDADFANRLRSACGNDDGLFRRLVPFAGLLRLDDFGFPVVILSGSVYVTSGTARRATGTHYTPRSLTEPVVQHTLEPLVYVGPAEGLPREQWTLRGPAELLDLKICDMAMGSGGFLVQVVRYLAERLVESVNSHQLSVNSDQPAPARGSSVVGGQSLITDYWSLTTEDRLTYARRLVAERCIYGVDKNPLAVEIAKLSLWLVTLARDLPFTFLNHALKAGDSLVGASEDDFLRWAHGYKASTMTLFDDQLRKQLETARAKRRELESFVVREAQDALRKDELLAEAEKAMAHIQRGADLLTGARLLGLKAQELEALQSTMLLEYMAGNLDSVVDPEKHYDASRALAAARKERAFHWEFAFPEVFERGGFSAFVGNPPFLGGTRISTMNSVEYLYYLQQTYPSFQSRADLCSIFFLKAYSSLLLRGSFGLIATNTISQGDTREAGLDKILNDGGCIYHAKNSIPWSGQASVIVSIIHVFKGPYFGDLNLDNKNVSAINSSLDSNSFLTKPRILSENDEMIFNGSKLDGVGFVLDEAEATSLFTKNPRNKDVVFKYLGGEDINTSPNQTPERWVINFFDWNLEKAENYPDCLGIVRERVFPQRQRHSEKRTKEHWWQFQRTRIELYQTIKDMNDILVTARVTKYPTFVFVPNNWVYNEKTFVFKSNKRWFFSVLQSVFHELWVWQFSSTLGLGLNYAPSDCFQTFPFPRDLTGLEQIGETYHETRREIMLARQEGLTKVYNRFHDPDERNEDILRLRGLHVEMDAAVAAAYGWGSDQSSVAQSSTGQGLELGHDFHETAQGIRFTISEAARREVLSRLLKLNHERWEEEQVSGKLEVESGKKTGKTGKSKNRKTDDGQMGMF